MKEKEPLTIIDFWKVKHQIDDEVARVGWSKQRCRAFIINRYGKISRRVMTDEQLLDLLDLLRSLNTKTTSTEKLRSQKERKRRKRR